MRVERRQGQFVGAGRIEPPPAPVHRHEDVTGFLAGIGRRRQDDFAAPAGQAQQVAGSDAAPLQVVRMATGHRQFDMVVEAGGEAGAAHAVPLVAQPAGIQMQRVAGIGRFGHRDMPDGDEAGATVGGRVAAILVEPRRACLGTGRVGPLLGAVTLQRRVVETGDVEIAAGGKRGVLGEDGGRLVLGEQARRVGSAQFVAQPQGEVAGDLPVGTRLAGRGGRRAHP